MTLVYPINKKEMVDGGAPLFFDSPFSSGERTRCAPRRECGRNPAGGRENQPEIRAGSTTQSMELRASGNKRVAPNPTYLFTAAEANYTKLHENASNPDRYERGAESGEQNRVRQKERETASGGEGDMEGEGGR